MRRAFIFKGKENDLPVSQKMSIDPFDGYYGEGIIEPPDKLDWLVRLPSFLKETKQQRLNVKPSCTFSSSVTHNSLTQS